MEKKRFKKQNKRVAKMTVVIIWIFMFYPNISSNDTNHRYGVYWNKMAQKWLVQRVFDGKRVFGGYFDNLEEAKRKADELIHDYEFETGIVRKRNQKLNFFAYKRDQDGNVHITPFENAYMTHGVCWDKRNNKWRVQRYFERKAKFGGYFSDFDEAKHASDRLVYEFEKQIRNQCKQKLNFARQEYIPTNIGKETSGEKRKRNKSQLENL